MRIPIEDDAIQQGIVTYFVWFAECYTSADLRLSYQDGAARQDIVISGTRVRAGYTWTHTWHQTNTEGDWNISVRHVHVRCSMKCVINVSKK